jgi:hypothetical protein
LHFCIFGLTLSSSWANGAAKQTAFRLANATTMLARSTATAPRSTHSGQVRLSLRLPLREHRSGTINGGCGDRVD